MAEEILTLEGDDAKAFLEYDSRELTAEEKATLKKAREYYLSKCKT
ncbi:hypothetical protein [Candidatus Nitrosotalea okcheonensis]|uniref:Uncharacterized protein n=1 Tax=Candidatus Nitrosotalea okcheonensis TaxID=1903276 RepID=A0A2H1FET2_9ARCH|nr:hypothetical protein [Candidatus Nitrosotalea okcheonensis]SMH71282.1 conserved protein of unknown function [Candidatus Nitrosotalea okcheonensis]